MTLYKKQDEQLIGLDGGINKNGGLINLKLQFFKEENIDLSKYPNEIDWIKIVVSNSIKAQVLTSEQIALANEIIKNKIKI